MYLVLRLYRSLFTILKASQYYHNVGFRKPKSVKKVTKRAHPLPVLHFLFSVYDYIMEHDLLCVTADCGQPRWRVGWMVLKRRRDRTRIQNGVVFTLRGNSIRPPPVLQWERSSLSGTVSAWVSILKSKAARSEIGRMGWRRGLNRKQNMIFWWFTLTHANQLTFEWNANGRVDDVIALPWATFRGYFIVFSLDVCFWSAQF